MSSTSTSELKVLAKFCNNGPCPTLYHDDEGRFFIQGDILPASQRSNLTVGDGEEIIELDAELLNFLRSYQL